MSQFIEAVNKRGEKQRIPAAWLEEGSPFAKQFKLPPSAAASEAPPAAAVEVAEDQQRKR